MKLICLKSNLLRGIQIIQAAISPRATMPVLSNFLIEAGDEKIKFISTDLEMCVKCEVKGKILSPGTITAPARRFSSIIQTLPEGKEIFIDVEESSILSIRSESTFFTLAGMSKEEFPALPEFKEKGMFKIPLNEFSEMLEMTSFAMSSEETRYVYNGMLFSVKDGDLELVATDGKRLSYVKKTSDKLKGINVKGIIPSKMVRELLRVFALESEENVLVSISETQAFFRINDIVMISRLIEGEFPDYKRVIPKEFEAEAILDTNDFLLGCKQSTLILAEESGSPRPVMFEFKENSLRISTSVPTIGSAEINFDVEYKGPLFKIAFNPNYLIDFLKNVSTHKITMRMSGVLRPALLQPLGKENCLYVVMPMRVE